MTDKFQLTNPTYYTRDAVNGILQPRTSTDKEYLFNNKHIYSNSDDALIKNLSFYKSRGTYASPSVITTGDYLGEMVGYGHDGTNYIRSASIRFKSSGTIGTNRIPSEIEFYIGTNASPSVETLRLSIGTNSRIEAGLPIQTNSQWLRAYYSGITTTSTDGFIAENYTPATVGTTVQMSPRLRFRGSAWDTDDAVSRTSDWIIENLPATGNTVSSTLKFGHSLAGGSYTYPMTLSSAGNLGILGYFSIGNGQNILNRGSQSYFNLNVGTQVLTATISRNTADAYSAFAINNAHASSTGNILDLQWQGVNRISFTKNGSINLNTTDNAGAGTININGNRYFHAYSPVVADSNLFLGYGAGNFTMAGTGNQASYNVGIGYGVLSNTSTGGSNIGIGYQSLRVTNSGTNNISIGYLSMYNNTTGSNNFALGTTSLAANVSGSSNIGIGSLSLYSTTVSNLIGIGQDALYSNTTGTGLVAVGYQAGRQNVKGTNNSYFGYQAGYSGTTVVSSIAITNGGTGYTAGNLIVDNTGTGGSGLAGTYTVDGSGTINGITITNVGSGYNSVPTVTGDAGGSGAVLTPALISANSNTATGYQALYSNTYGERNTANGYASLYSNTTGIYNTANGYYSLFSNTTGSQNTANGMQSLYSNTTGSYNTANGMYSISSNTTGNYNTASGMYSLYYNTTGSQNTANGYYSLFSNTTGVGNVGEGYQAGRTITEGNYNTFLGYDAGYNASQLATASNSIGIGYGAYTDASNLCQIGNSSLTLVRSAGDFECSTADGGVILKSPDGTRYKIKVENGGTLTVVAV